MPAGILDIEAQKADAKAVVDQFAQFWETQDMDLLSKIMAHDVDMVNYGTDAGEYFVGWKDLQESIENMLPFLDSIKIAVRDQTINVNPSGQVAWFSQVWDWDLVVQGQPIQNNGQRLTGVLENRNGNWVFVQFHNSVPVQG